jgi:hypothetical protein
MSDGFDQAIQSFTRAIELMREVQQHIDQSQRELRKQYKPDPQKYWVFKDDREMPIYVSEEKHGIQFNRSGRWVEVQEIV